MEIWKYGNMKIWKYGNMEADYYFESIDIKYEN